MKKLLFLMMASAIVFTAGAQNIKLTQTAAASDIKVISNGYTLHFKSADLLAAIKEIDNVNKTDNSSIATAIKDKKIKSVNLNPPSADDLKFAEFFNAQLGCYLLSRGKVTITKGGKTLKAIAGDESPQVVDLDGSSKVHIDFMDDEELVFTGQLNYKLKPKN
jgi:hypothetical protein